MPEKEAEHDRSILNIYETLLSMSYTILPDVTLS